jgi:predicted RNA-binding Zn-ribbon protein involved in translation (DUF1610 family)
MADTKLFALLCPGCGANLKVSASLGTFACAYCGASIRLDRTESTVSLKLLADGLSAVQHGTDRTAAELAIRRLTDELKALERQKADVASAREVRLAQWKRQMAPFSRDKSIWFAVVVAGSSFMVAVVLVDKHLGSNSFLQKWIPVVLAAVTGFYVWRTIRRWSQRLIARAKQGLDSDYAALDRQELAIQEQIDVATRRLSAHRAVANS